MSEEKNFSFYHLVALFLSEIIRSRRVSLRRGAEIAQSVVDRLSFIHSEEEALMMITDIEKEFEEVVILKQALQFGFEKNDTKVFENEIKDFASKIFLSDMAESAEFLHYASKEKITIQELCLRYPAFCVFLNSCANKV
jgi:hypothetical protein